MKRKIRRTGEMIDVITFSSSTTRKGEIDCGVYVPDVVSWSITIADRIIEAMRGVKNA